MTKIAFPLKARILLLLVLGVALFGSVNVWLFRRLLLQSLSASVTTQGRAVADLVAEEGAPYLLRRDEVGLAGLMNSYREKNADILYIVFYNPQGAVVQGTFGKEAPPFLLRPRGGEPSPGRYQSGGVYFQDFGAVVLKGGLGSVRVGLSESAIRSRATYGQRLLLAMVALFFLAGVAGSYVIAQDVNRDAVAIAAAVETFTLGATLPALPVRRGDELGLVARALKDMMERLQRLHDEHLSLLARFRDADRMSSVGLIASGLAHDINNPLSGLLASVERLEKDPGNREKALAYLPAMAEAARHIREVLHNLLQFVRRQRYEEMPVDLRGTAVKAQLLLGHRLGGATRLTVDIPETLPRVRFDPACLLQVLVNLLLNAADAMEERAGDITMSARGQGQEVVLTIADEGAGMAPEVLHRIFEPLFTTKPPGRGTGLGLPIARQMMKDHGGDITLESEPGSGTRVTLTFKIAEP